MHPSSILIIWLFLVLSTQFLSYAWLGLVVFALCCQRPSLILLWLNTIWRAKWLLFMMWVILAYSTPGELFHDIRWAPTYEGLAGANLHLARLLAMLACLAWLFSLLGKDGLVNALWGILLPVQRLGINSQRLLVRLSLVLTNLEQAADLKADWRHMLTGKLSVPEASEVLYLKTYPWSLLDVVLIFFAAACLFYVVFW